MGSVRGELNKYIYKLTYSSFKYGCSLRVIFSILLLSWIFFWFKVFSDFRSYTFLINLCRCKFNIFSNAFSRVSRNAAANSWLPRYLLRLNLISSFGSLLTTVGILVFLALLLEMFVFKSDKYFQFKGKYILVMFKPLNNIVYSTTSTYFYEKYDYFNIIF